MTAKGLPAEGAGEAGRELCAAFRHARDDVPAARRIVKMHCEECALARRRERWLRPCRHWRWLARGHMAPRRGVRVVAMSDRILASMPDAAPWIPLGSLRLIANRHVTRVQTPPVEALSSLQPERSSLVNGWQPLGVVIASGGFRIAASGE